MAQTQAAVKPSLKQQEVLDALVRDRAAVVTETTKSGKTRKTVAVVTPTGRPVEGIKLDRHAVESAARKGWLQDTGSSGGVVDGVFIQTRRYEVTFEGKAARKGK